MSSKKGHTHHQWMVAVIGNLAVMSYGLQAAWMSPMSKLLRSENTPTDQPLSDSQISLIASAFCLTAALSTIPYALMADVYGRRISLMTVVAFQVLSWSIKLSTSSVAGLIVARIMCGVAAGGCFNIVPMYVKEISQESMKGVLGSLLILFQNVGLMAMYAMGTYLEYRTLITMALALPVVNMMLLFRCPESPAFLMKIGKEKETVEVLSYLRGLDARDKELENEVQSFRNEIAIAESTSELSYIDIFKNPGYRKAFIIINCITLVQATNGNFVTLSYAASIMADAGVTVSPDLQTMTFPAIMIVGSFVSMALVEKTGRKVIYTAFVALTSLAIGVLATSLLVQAHGGVTPGWIPVVTLMIVAFSYAAGVCPVPYLVMAETFNIQVRSKLIGVIVTIAWISSFFQLLCFSSVANGLGLYTAFYIYAGINLFGVFYALVYMPETKGLSVEQIENRFRK